MSTRSDNPLWYRVAEARPRLVAHAEVQKQVFRGDVWYVLHNLAAGRAYRFSPRFNFFIAQLDGRRTVEQVWSHCLEVQQDDALSQDEVMEILARLYLADVLQSDQAGDAFELFERQRRQRQAHRLSQARNPLAVRVPLFDPDRLLTTLLPLGRVVFSRAGFGAWLLLMLAGIATALSNLELLVGGEKPQLLSADNLLILGLCYPLIKALHELGHGLATKVWGGEVHQAGLLLVAFIPLPYVDASAANTFPEKRRRIAVGGAGILVETSIAVLALFLWLAVEPGLVHEIAYNVMLIGAVSTLIFNGNPLMKFDGYYMLTDAAGLPNLASRANRYIGYLIKRYAFALNTQRSPVTHDSEVAWLFGYGVLSYVYRIVILLTIALFVAEAYPTIGIVLAAWSLLSSMLWPIAKHSAKLFTDPELERRRTRALTLSTSCLLVVVTAVFVVPAPLVTMAEGVVAPPDDAQIRAGRAGVVRRFASEPDSHVDVGSTLIELDDPFIDAEIAGLEAKLNELQARRKILQSDRKQVEVSMLDDDIAVVREDLAKARDDLAALSISSRTRGTFLVAEIDDLPGRYVEQGELLGFVADLKRPTLRVAVAQSDVGLVKHKLSRVTVRLAEHPEQAFEATVVRQVPGALERLPSAVLGANGGGPFAIDPTDEGGDKPIEGVFEYDLRLPVAVERLGGRGYVRFDHGHEPLGQQWFRRLRQLFLSRFNV